MKSISFIAATIIVAGCARGPAVATGPTPPPPSRAPLSSTPIPGPSLSAPIVLKALRSAPPDWHRLSVETDGVFGVGSERALRELLASRQPSRRVVVAVIDGGVDTASALLRGNLWRNAAEQSNGRDDDGDGLIDDVMGWNFLGGAGLVSVNYETLEVTRQLAACRSLPAGVGTPKPDAAHCMKIAAAYDSTKGKYSEQSRQVANITSIETQVSAVLQRSLGTTALTRRDVMSLAPVSDAAKQARTVWLQLNEQGLTGQALLDEAMEIDSTLVHGFDLNSTARSVVGDSVGNTSQRSYGNGDVTGPDAKHGTHVAGIIGAMRGKGDVQGIAPSVQLMSVRTVPTGDERDKDVANAIRYAVDHGANIINMSFGKPYASAKLAVDNAVRYAQDKGVLLIHAAGNDGANNDSTESYPSPEFLDHGRASTWIEVGASSWNGLAELAAPFSNYGHNTVDLFAPGVDVLSTVPGNRTEALSGTSMAAPVVSGVAALVMSYFPKLSASDVRDILLASARTVSTTVTIPGGEQKVPFSSLSRSGGIVDAYAAVRMALSRTGATP